jgi:hypothetical protein
MKTNIPAGAVVEPSKHETSDLSSREIQKKKKEETLLEQLRNQGQQILAMNRKLDTNVSQAFIVHVLQAFSVNAMRFECAAQNVHFN